MAYLKLPKQLFKNPEYKTLSSNAKLLYALLLDRQELSRHNNMTDGYGNVIVYFKRKEAAELLNLTVRSTQKVFEELRKSGLLQEKPQGIGKAYLLYVKNFLPQCEECSDDGGINFLSQYTNSSAHDVQILPPNNTELNNTDYNNNELNNTDLNNAESDCVFEEISSLGSFYDELPF